MKSQSDTNEPTIVTSAFDGPSWNRPRTTEELRGFIANREASLGDCNDELDDIFRF